MPGTQNPNQVSGVKKSPVEQASLTPEDEAKMKRNTDLINRASEFGLDLDKFQNIYNKNPEAAQAYLNGALAQTSIAEGGRLFKGDQSKIGSAFSDFMKADPSVKKMFEEKYDTNVFKGDEGEDFKNFQKMQADDRAYDQETKRILQSIGGDVSKREQEVVANNTNRAQTYKQQIEQQRQAELKGGMGNVAAINKKYDDMSAKVDSDLKMYNEGILGGNRGSSTIVTGKQFPSHDIQMRENRLKYLVKET